MMTVVQTSEEDPQLSVVRFTSELSWADAGPEVASPHVERLCIEAQECLVAGRVLDLASLMLTSADLIFSKVSEKDLECIFTVICNLVTKSENLDEILEIAKLISAKVAQQPNDKPALRLKILFNLYNLLTIPYGRFSVYMQALNLAVNGKVAEHIVPSFKKIDGFLKEWNLNLNEQRDLFLAMSNVAKECKGSAKDSFKFLIKYLATFSGEDAATMSEAKEQSVKAIIDFLKAPDVFQCDLLDMPAVAQLENDSQYSSVYQLLRIFLTQKLDSYLEYHAANSSLLKDYGLVHEDCVIKMRLMSLVDLGSSESGRIPYAVIRDTLQVNTILSVAFDMPPIPILTCFLQLNDDEVEFWVVKAISAKLLDCKMDQMNQVIIVSRCSERVFGQRQWELLRSKLATWKENVASVMATIQVNKIADDVTQAAQGMAIH
ncbi:hypothetical protein SAY87_007626 [Trapa incisa]|uniref:Eukaryotic translation initiation factor 3 subunit M n=1 Tax=Trapa incisa TaxID=236973 RepID=A0AAN7KEQ4_9MYRT|nr:hypothetical protein SAY87_007626 [Trapa incisa]